MLAKTFITAIAALSLLSPTVLFAQGGQGAQQQGQQQIPSPSRQDQQIQQRESRPPQGQQQQARITADVQVTPQGQLSEEERRALSLAAGRLLKHVPCVSARPFPANFVGRRGLVESLPPWQIRLTPEAPVHRFHNVT